MQCFAHHGLFLLHRQAYCTCTYICTVCTYVCISRCVFSLLLVCACECAYVHTYIHTVCTYFSSPPSLLSVQLPMQTLLPLHYDAVSAMALWDNTLCSACGVTIKLWSMDNSRIKQVRTHIFIAYTRYSASEFVQDMLYIQYICTYICTHVRTYVRV